MAPGDRLDRWTTGGGYGDPLERSPDAALEDVLDGKVNRESAAERYGMVIRDGELDQPATAALGERLRTDRGPITWTIDRGRSSASSTLTSRRARAAPLVWRDSRYNCLVASTPPPLSLRLGTDGLRALDEIARRRRVEHAG